MFEFEKQVLGTAINNRKSIPTMMASGLTDECFENEDSAKLWRFLVKQTKISGDVNYPKIDPPIGIDFYTACATAAYSMDPGAMADGMVRLAKRKKLAIRMGFLAKEIAQTPPLSEEKYTTQALNLLVEAASGDSSFITPEYSTLVGELAERIDRRINDFKNKEKNIITTGFKQLDTLSGGFVPRRLYVIAARTGQGKTTMAINMADEACAAGFPVAYFTVEMENVEILEKILSKRTMVNSRLIDSGDITDGQSKRLVDQLFSIHRELFINHKFRGSYNAMESEIRRLVAAFGVKVVFVDYIQQLRLDNFNKNNRHLEISEISSKLKSLAMELEINVVVLAQLNRDASDEVPKLHHIKDSGSIEQDADLVMFIHKTKLLANYETWIRVEKNRRGPSGKFRIDVDFATNCVSNSKDDRLVEE